MNKSHKNNKKEVKENVKTSNIIKELLEKFFKGKGKILY